MQRPFSLIRNPRQEMFRNAGGTALMLTRRPALQQGHAGSTLANTTWIWPAVMAVVIFGVLVGALGIALLASVPAAMGYTRCSGGPRPNTCYQLRDD